MCARSLQLCPTLCNPIDGSPPGSPIPGILQARTLERVAISFSNGWNWKVKVKLPSRVWLSSTPWTAAYQAPPSMGFSRQEYQSGLPLPSPNELQRPVKTCWYFQVTLNWMPVLEALMCSLLFPSSAHSVFMLKKTLIACVLYNIDMSHVAWLYHGHFMVLPLGKKKSTQGCILVARNFYSSFYVIYFFT